MLILRSASPDELRALVGWEGEPDTATWLSETGAAWHSRALADPDQEHVVAVNDESLVGFAVLAGLCSDDGIELRRMVVAPAHRSRGLGRALLHAVVDRAYRHHEAKAIWLDVKSHNNRARSLYESSGFVVRETRENAIIEADGTTSDLVIMIHRPSQ